MCAGIRKEIITVANLGEVLVIEKDLLQEYENNGGDCKDLKEILIVAYEKSYKKELQRAEKSAKSGCRFDITLEYAQKYYNSLIELDPSKKLEKGISAEIERIRNIFRQAKP